MQNKSHAVMAQRAELKTSLDDFPTPPWATRALLEHVVASKTSLGSMTCLEPACGRGHMSVALAEYFGEVVSHDVFAYGFGGVANFLKSQHAAQSFDWVITNPPFKLGEEFIKRSLKIARHGVAVLARTVFIESVGRYERLFKQDPPSAFAQFVERVPMVKGRIDKSASTATGYGWLV
jgi:type I restriction-modification system DNA methylase subunit